MQGSTGQNADTDNDSQTQVKDQLKRATALLRNDEVDAAEDLLLAMLDEYPEVPQIFVALARCSIKQDNYELAKEYVQSALAQKKDMPNAYNLRGEIYLAYEDDNAAFDDFQKAVELKPSLVKAHINLAQLYIADDQWDQARRHCETALEYEPHRDALRLMLCNIHENAGDLVAAQEEAYAAVQANPENVGAYMKEGMISFKQGDLLQAEKSFEGLLKHRPDSALGNYFLGLAASGQQKFQLAESSLIRAQQLASAAGQKSNDLAERIGRLLVKTYTKQEKYEQALIIAKKLTRHSPSLSVLKQLADIYYSMGQHELANQQYRAIVLGNSRLAGANPALGRMLEHEGSDPQATADAWREAFAKMKNSKQEPVDESEQLSVASIS